MTTIEPGELLRPGTLAVCVGPAPAPFVTRRAGFDLALMRAIADRLAVDVRMVRTGDALHGPVERRCDVGVGRIRVTLETQRDASLVPYLEVGHALLVAGGSAVEPRRVCGVRLAVVRGAAREDTAAELRKRCAVGTVLVPSGADGVRRLRSGAVDAVLDDTPVNATRAVRGLELARPDVGHVRYGIAVAPRLDSLYFAVRGALAVVQEDGTFRRLQHRWGLSGAHMIGLA